MKFGKKYILVAILLIVSLISLTLISDKEGAMSLPGNTTIRQWDVANLNSILQQNGISPVNPNDYNGMTTKTINFFATLPAPNDVPYAGGTETYSGEWTKRGRGVCTSDNGARSIQITGDRRTDMFPGLPSLNYANLRPDERKMLEDKLAKMNLKTKSIHEQRYETCKAYADYKNANTFGLQYYGWCLVGNTKQPALGEKKLNGHMYYQFGTNPNGTDCGVWGIPDGGGWSNNVFTKQKSISLYKFDSEKLASVVQKLHLQGYSDMYRVLSDQAKDNLIF
jgi:hypothetical protein